MRIANPYTQDIRIANPDGRKIASQARNDGYVCRHCEPAKQSREI